MLGDFVQILKFKSRRVDIGVKDMRRSASQIDLLSYRERQLWLAGGGAIHLPKCQADSNESPASFRIADWSCPDWPGEEQEAGRPKAVNIPERKDSTATTQSSPAEESGQNSGARGRPLKDWDRLISLMLEEQTIANRNSIPWTKESFCARLGIDPRGLRRALARHRTQASAPSPKA